MIAFLSNKGTRLLHRPAPSLRTVGSGVDVAHGGPGPASIRPRSSLPTAPKRTARISCVMPAYDEREVIRRSVERVRQSLEGLAADFEIIVVDDGSTDGTGRILDEMADERLRVIHFAENEGYGRALRAGFDAAVHPLVFFTDSDDQFDPDDIGRLLPLIEEADMVVGRRACRSDGAMRSLLSGGYNALVRGLLGLDVRDVNCAFKLIRRDALSSLALGSDGYAINAEMLARATSAGLRIREVPVSHHLRRTGRSKVGLRDIPRSLARVVELRRAIRGAAIAGGPSRRSRGA